VREGNLDYRDPSCKLQRIRGPYTFAAGIAAYGKRIRLQHGQQSISEAGQPVHDAGADVAYADAGEGRR
jgi:hypothetical protein